MEQLREARKWAEECVALSEHLNKPDTRFGGRLVLARIDHALGESVSALNRLDELFAQAQSEIEQAGILYELSKIHRDMGNPDQATPHTDRALELYRRLYARTPRVIYRRRIEELTSVH